MELETDIFHYLEITSGNPKAYAWTKTADQILAKVARFCRRTLDPAQLNPTLAARPQHHENRLSWKALSMDGRLVNRLSPVPQVQSTQSGDLLQPPYQLTKLSICCVAISANWVRLWTRYLAGCIGILWISLAQFPLSCLNAT